MGFHGGVTVLPTVDLRAESGQLRESLREAAHEAGFCYLTGHDVSGELAGRVLDVARRLFALSQADKDAIAMVRSPHFRGYTRLGSELTPVGSHLFGLWPQRLEEQAAGAPGCGRGTRISAGNVGQANPTSAQGASEVQ